MQKVHIIGTGGLGKEIISYIVDERPQRYEIVGVWDDEKFDSETFNQYYMGNIADASTSILQSDSVLLCVAHPRVKKILIEKLGGENAFSWCTYVHPTATVSSFAKLGKGCVITPQCIVSPDVTLGQFVFMNTGSVVGHDSILGEKSTLFPNSEVCGDCILGKECILGIGAFTVPGVNLPDRTRVSAGSIVWESSAEAGLMSGNPAQIVRK